LVVKELPASSFMINRKSPTFLPILCLQHVLNATQMQELHSTHCTTTNVKQLCLFMPPTINRNKKKLHHGLFLK